MKIAAQLTRLPDMPVRVVVTEAIGAPIRIRNRTTAALRLVSVAGPDRSYVALAMIR